MNLWKKWCICYASDNRKRICCVVVALAFAFPFRNNCVLKKNMSTKKNILHGDDTTTSELKKNFTPLATIPSKLTYVMVACVEELIQLFFVLSGFVVLYYFLESSLNPEFVMLSEIAELEKKIELLTLYKKDCLMAITTAHAVNVQVVHPIYNIVFQQCFGLFVTVFIRLLSSSARTYVFTESAPGPSLGPLGPSQAGEWSWREMAGLQDVNLTSRLAGTLISLMGVIFYPLNIHIEYFPGSLNKVLSALYIIAIGGWGLACGKLGMVKGAAKQAKSHLGDFELPESNDDLEKRIIEQVFNVLP